MAIIKICELQPAGSDLFHDSESFLNELTNDALKTIEGGINFNLAKFLAVLSIKITDLGKLKSYQTVISVKGNSVNNNTINGQTINGHSASNVNTW